MVCARLEVFAPNLFVGGSSSLSVQTCNCSAGSRLYLPTGVEEVRLHRSLLAAWVNLESLDALDALLDAQFISFGETVYARFFLAINRVSTVQISGNF